ncbi:MAG: tyrosine-type recombinase/integrase [Actinomycetes bacterium]
MSPPAPFTSAIGPTIATYIAYKQALGRRYDSQRQVLVQLDRFLAVRAVSDLTAESFSAWCSSLAHMTADGRRKYMLLVRQFCLYRRRGDCRCFVPDPTQFPAAQPRRRPHVFSEDEIARCLHAAGSLRCPGDSPLHRQCSRLALALLYTSGLRRGELVRLRLGDYDAVEHVLLVRDSKFHKSRLIPLSKDAATEIGHYLEDRRRPGFPCEADAPLLLHRNGGRPAPYSGNGVRTLMRHLFQMAGVRTCVGRLPRVHDLRFTFAFHALLRWYRAGADVQARLPALATYMGHASILSTEYYLPTLDVLASEASERFERHCARILDATLDERGAR